MEQTPTRKPIFTTPDAHKDLVRLAELLTQSKGVKVSYTNAASIAIINETRRLERLAERRQQRQRATS